MSIGGSRYKWKLAFSQNGVVSCFHFGHFGYILRTRGSGMTMKVFITELNMTSRVNSLITVSMDTQYVVLC